VVHNEFSSRVGCGLILPALRGATVELGSYPSYTGSSRVRGLLVFSERREDAPDGAGTALRVRGSVSGLPAAQSGGWHVHVGATCDSHAGVGGHFFSAMPSDPWNAVQYTTNSRGVATVDSSASAELAQRLEGFTLRDGRATLGRAVVVHDPSGGRAGCGVLGAHDDATVASMAYLSAAAGGSTGFVPGGRGVVDELSRAVASVHADFIDVGVVWMRAAPPLLVALLTVMLVGACTVCLLPALVMALVVGYGFTYAYGGTAGVPCGTLVLWLGTLCGAVCAFLLAQRPLCVAAVGRLRAPLLLVPALESLDGQPLKLLVLLRVSPLTPFPLLNYYAGACGRFELRHVAAAHLATLPYHFCFVGVGGAILKWRLMDRGEASVNRYAPFVWSGFSVTFVLLLLSTALVVNYARRAAARASATPAELQSTATGAPETSRTTSVGTSVGAARSASVSKRSTSSTLRGSTARVRQYSKMGGEEIGVEINATPPPPPPSSDGPPLAAGWRELTNDEGDVYYWNDDTGESQWEPPTLDEHSQTLPSTLPGPPVGGSSVDALATRESRGVAE
jgi:uncharacterized membrane protein YdjX (TVP38/TMEM64 family)